MEQRKWRTREDVAYAREKNALVRHDVSLEAASSRRCAVKGCCCGLKGFEAIFIYDRRKEAEMGGDAKCGVQMRAVWR